tara:strand:- start:573 stop:2162 length:1590 start_codon:yes stop_codon:yes gene_type:complete
MVNDPLMESERNIEARQSKLTRKDAAPKFAMNNDIQEMQQANQFKKTRKITGVSKIDNRIRIGLSKIKSPGFFKRGKKGNIDEAISPIVDVRKGNLQILKEAGLLAVPVSKVSKLKPLSSKVIAQINKIPTPRVFGKSKQVYQPAKPVTQSYYANPDFEGLPLSAFTNKQKLRQVTTKQKIGIAGVGTGVAGMVAAPIIPQAKTTDLPKTRPMISVDTMEETLTKPITTTTARPKTRPMISRDPLEEDLSIPSITTPDIKIPEPTIPEPSIPDITIPEIKIPEPKVPSITVPRTDIPTPQTIDEPIITDEEIDFDIPTEPITRPRPITKPVTAPSIAPSIVSTTPSTIPSPITTPTVITTPVPVETPEPLPTPPPPSPTPKKTKVATAPPPLPSPTPITPPPPTQTVRGDRTRKRFRRKESGTKVDFDKRKSAELPYPSKVQYKEKDKYVTFNLNTNKKKVFNTPQGIGVNPGTTPEDTLKVIQKQKTKPKFKKYKLGNLVLSVTSPETIVIRRLKAFRNNKTNKRFRR